MIKKIFCIRCDKYRKFKNHKISYISIKQFFLSFVVSAAVKMKKIIIIKIKEEESIKKLKIFSLVNNL